MVKINGNEIRKGNVIEHKSGLWIAVKTSHVKPGKGGAFAQVELKNIRTNSKLNERFRSADKIEKVRLEQKDHQFLYKNNEDWIGVSKCRLHEAAVLGRMRKHKKALKCLGFVISDMESGKLESSTISQAERLCMVTICYHNIAALEIQLENFQQACIASQNARRLARLCLSFSNRWLKQLDATHRNALVAMISAREMREVFSSVEEKEYFSSLATAYYA